MTLSGADWYSTLREDFEIDKGDRTWGDVWKDAKDGAYVYGWYSAKIGRPPGHTPQGFEDALDYINKSRVEPLDVQFYWMGYHDYLNEHKVNEPVTGHYTCENCNVLQHLTIQPCYNCGWANK